MERAAAAMALLVTAGAPAAGQALSLADTVRVLPGVWELDPVETAESERGAFRCNVSPLEISIERAATGELRYESRRIGEDEVARSAVMSLPTRSGRAVMLLHYEDEERLDAEGRSVEWVLEMPDADRFYWVRRDWLSRNPVERTAMRRRCPVATS